MILSTSIRSWFGHLIRWVKTIFSLKSGLIFLLVVLFSAFVAVMVSENLCWISPYLGLSDKNKILTFLGIGMGGILLALQAVIANKRAQAMEDAANSQAEANQNTERGQRQERFKNAIEHLGHQSVSVRLGGAYELFHLAEDTTDEAKDLRQTVMDILCAHIRRTTGETEYRRNYAFYPSEEIQSLLTLMFVQEHEVFKGCRINLQGSWLNRASLDRARLRGAILDATSLQGAILTGAHLQGSVLVMTRLNGAYLTSACLQGTVLMNTYLEQAILVGARLQGAVFQETHLQGANLLGAQMQGVKRFQFRGIDWMSMGFAERIRTLINQESDLSGAVFAGGLTQEDVDNITKGLPDPQATKLQTQLNSHIRQPPNCQLPENSGAITGAYTEEEAEIWIAEYEKTMSDFPKAANGQ